MKKFILSLLAAVGVALSASAATNVWEGEYEFNAEGNGWQEVSPELFADLQHGDKLVVTVSAITNPDGWAQINLAGKDPWTVVPGTNWGEVKVGENEYVIDDVDLLASIKSGGLGIQGKYYVLTAIRIEGAASSVHTVVSQQKTDEIYNLNGVRTNGRCRGVNVCGGKKYFFSVGLTQ